METTERIVEAYCRHIKRWFTIPNIKAKNNEVDLIAMDKDGNKAHIEIGVSISGSFSKLNNDPYTPGEEKQRTNQAKARTKLGYFIHKKFGSPEVVDMLGERYGFFPGGYTKIIVAWDADPEAIRAADEQGIQVWLLRVLIRELKQLLVRDRGYHSDDTIRTLHLVARAEASQGAMQPTSPASTIDRGTASGGRIPLDAWKRFVALLPGDQEEVEYSIEEISDRLGHDLKAEESPTKYNQYWQSKRPHVEVWRRAGWTAKPRRDPGSRKIVAVRFVRSKDERGHAHTR